MAIEIKAVELAEIINSQVMERIEHESIGKLEMLKKIVDKMTDFTKEKFIEGLRVDLFVSDIRRAEIHLQSALIKKISNFWLVYMFHEVVRSDITLGNKKVIVDLFKYNKDVYEIKDFFNTLMNCITNLDKGVQLDLDSIDAILTNKEKNKYAKRARKSVVSTLTGVKENLVFREHPGTKNGIVSIEELGAYIDLKNKHKTLHCPICNEKYLIDKENMDDVIIIDKNMFVFNCLHEDSGDPNIIKIGPFKKDLGMYFNDGYSKIEKQMFILNNFKWMTCDGSKA